MPSWSLAPRTWRHEHQPRDPARGARGTGALSLADALITVDPRNEDAQKVADTCRARLRAIYLGRIGALDQVPAMVIPSTEIRRLALDHRAGFVLSLVDGTSSIEEIIDVSSMEPLEVLRTLYNLITQNVITLRGVAQKIFGATAPDANALPIRCRSPDLISPIAPLLVGICC